MAERIGELGYIIIDSADPERLASFWSQVLGLAISDRSHPYIDLAPANEKSPVISFQKVDESKITKNRLHLDIKVADLEIATQRIIDIGGKLIEICTQDPYEWHVMSDPEENEFCIVTN